MCGFYEESSSSERLKSVTLGNKAIRRKRKDRTGVAFYILSVSKLVLFVLVCMCVCVVCELLLMYDDKDLGSLKAAAMALYFWFLILR